MFNLDTIPVDPIEVILMESIRLFVVEDQPKILKNQRGEWVRE